MSSETTDRYEANEQPMEGKEEDLEFGERNGQTRL